MTYRLIDLSLTNTYAKTQSICKSVNGPLLHAKVLCAAVQPPWINLSYSNCPLLIVLPHVFHAVVRLWLVIKTWWISDSCGVYFKM